MVLKKEQGGGKFPRTDQKEKEKNKTRKPLDSPSIKPLQLAQSIITQPIKPLHSLIPIYSLVLIQ